MSDETTRPLDRFPAPFGKQVELQEVALENDVTLLRVRIREGSRFTVMDLDPVTAKRWGETMTEWAQAFPTDGGRENDSPDPGAENP